MTDHLNLRGGAGQHLIQVIGSAHAAGASVSVAYGRRDPKVVLPDGVAETAIRGLASQVSSRVHIHRLAAALKECDIAHVQNVLNPEALSMAAATGRAVVTVQDHRVFCPSIGKTLPDGSRCEQPMSETACSVCVADRAYLLRVLDLTRERLEALDGARIVVLSSYMASELASAGIDGIEIIPPWVEAGATRAAAGEDVLLGGRLVTHKDALLAWQAWRRCAMEIALRVAGEGTLGDRMVGADHLGWLSPAELRRELRARRALLFPARWQEPLGILGVEALSEGTPVIVADVGGTRDWSGAGCIRVPPGDVEAMAGAIRRLASSPDEALELGRRGQEFVAETFDRARIEPRLLDVYAAF
jgi:hypothetical protein